MHIACAVAITEREPFISHEVRHSQLGAQRLPLTPTPLPTSGVRADSEWRTPILIIPRVWALARPAAPAMSAPASAAYHILFNTLPFDVVWRGPPAAKWVTGARSRPSHARHQLGLASCNAKKMCAGIAKRSLRGVPSPLRNFGPGVTQLTVLGAIMFDPRPPIGGATTRWREGGGRDVHDSPVAALDLQTSHPTSRPTRGGGREFHRDPDILAVGARSLLIRDRARMAR